MSAALIAAAQRLSTAVDALSFSEPVHTVYNPLGYAWAPHELFLERFGARPGRVLMLGMNPGPFGMAQTGVPFGDVSMVRDWMGVEAPVAQPSAVHPKRPIEGFALQRKEVSGQRLWGWAQQRYGSADHFFEHYFVYNVVPLVFMGETGRNVTPDKLPSAERDALLAVSDEGLRDAVAALRPSAVVGIGAFAEKRAKAALGNEIAVHRILHPSPASPAANRGWAPQAERQLARVGLLR